MCAPGSQDQCVLQVESNTCCSCRPPSPCGLLSSCDRLRFVVVMTCDARTHTHIHTPAWLQAAPAAELLMCVCVCVFNFGLPLFDLNLTFDLQLFQVSYFKHIDHPSLSAWSFTTGSSFVIKPELRFNLWPLGPDWLLVKVVRSTNILHER